MLKNQKEIADQKLIGPFGLLKKTLKVYRNNFLTVVGIMLVPVAVNFLVTLSQVSVSARPGSPMWLISFKYALLVLTGIISIFISAWSYLAILLSVKNNLDGNSKPISIVEAYLQSLNKLPAYIYINILAAIATIPGIILFGIPTIIYLIWFAFAAFVMISENHYGAGALMRSREYVIHRWWRVAGRILFIVALLIAVQSVGPLLSRVFSITIVKWIVPNLIAILTVPLSITYAYSLYLNLKETRPELTEQPVNEKYKWLYILSPTTALVLITIIAGILISLLRGV